MQYSIHIHGIHRLIITLRLPKAVHVVTCSYGELEVRLVSLLCACAWVRKAIGVMVLGPMNWQALSAYAAAYKKQCWHTHTQTNKHTHSHACFNER